MKLTYKINIVVLTVLTAFGLAIAVAGVSTISEVIYDLNKEVMSREVDNVVAAIRGSYNVLVDNQLDAVDSYTRQAQADALAELKNYRYGKTGQLTIVNRSRQVVRHPDMASGLTADIPHLDIMVQQHTGTMEFNYRGKDRFFSYKLFPQWGWLVMLSVTSDEMLAARDRFVTHVVVILLATLILGALVLVWFIRRIVGPIRQLAAATAYVSTGKWDAPLPRSGGSEEVTQLTTAFRRMAHRLANMYGSIQDNLRELEKSQSALRESEEKYRGLVEMLPLVVFETDTSGKFIFANRSALDTFGYTDDDIQHGLSLYDVTIGKDHDRLKGDLTRVLSGRELGVTEYAGRRKDRSRFPCMVLAAPVYNRSQVVGTRGIFIDITDRKTLESDLRQAREFLNTILNNVADPIYVKDDQYRFVLVNDAFCRFFGRLRDNVVGRTDHELFPAKEADGFREMDELVFSSQKPYEKEESVTGYDGQHFIVLNKKTVFKDTHGKSMLVGIIKDITQRKQMEQELFKSRKLKSIGVLAGGIAHDFNNILTAIIGNLSLTKMLTDPDSRIHRRIVASEEASIQAKDLTQQLLTFSRGGAPVKQTISLGRLISASISKALKGTDLSCDLSIPDDLCLVDADERQVERVIHNLVINAVQAMPDGGAIHIDADNCDIRAVDNLPLSSGRYVRFVIKDQGIGIAQELLPDIFDPYFSTKEDGSGLGLATAFSIVKRHDGHICVVSGPNEGATFTVYLPASGKTVRHIKDKRDALVKGQGRILVMDDEKMVRDVVGRMLKLLGYSVEYAEDGNQALEKYQASLETGNTYDLVLMDLTIPYGMGGQQAVEKLLETDPGAKAIVASGYSNDPVMANYREHGFIGMIAKPFEVKKLSQVVHKALRD